MDLTGYAPMHHACELSHKESVLSLLVRAWMGVGLVRLVCVCVRVVRTRVALLAREHHRVSALRLAGAALHQPGHPIDVAHMADVMNGCTTHSTRSFELRQVSDE